MCTVIAFNCTRWTSWMARHCTWQTWIHPPGSDSRGVRSGPGPNPRSLPSPNRCRSRSNTCPHWCHGSRDETSRYWCTFMGCAKVLQKLGFTCFLASLTLTFSAFAGVTRLMSWRFWHSESPIVCFPFSLKMLAAHSSRARVEGSIIWNIKSFKDIFRLQFFN